MTEEMTSIVLSPEQAARVECANHAAEILRARTGVAGLGSIGGKLSSWEIIDLATWLCTGEKAVYPEDAEETEAEAEPEPCCQDRDPRHVERTFGMPEPEVMTA